MIALLPVPQHRVLPLPITIGNSSESPTFTPGKRFHPKGMEEPLRKTSPTFTTDWAAVLKIMQEGDLG